MGPSASDKINPVFSGPEIFVDADACPVRAEIYDVVARLSLITYVVGNGASPIRPSQLPTVKMIIVAEGMDAADDWIAEHITDRDICLTNDIPLAARCLAKGAKALGFNGKVWSQDNIGNALAGRELNRHLRELGMEGGGGKSYGKADRTRFLNAFDAAIAAVRRSYKAGV